MNTNVSFEIAKLLKEKGFSNHCSNFYTNPRCKMFGIDEHGRYYPIKNKAKTLWISGHVATLDSRHVYYAPTISDVVMWLHKEHKIWISVDPDNDTDTWFYTISHNKSEVVFGNYSGPTEAYEAAIEHVLNNLI